MTNLARMAYLSALVCVLLIDMRGIGGDEPKPKKPSPFESRNPKEREKRLKDLGGNEASEAGVTAGLRWLARHQAKDGSWKLDDQSFKDKGTANDVAGTAFGLLPFLAAGHTHKSAKDEEYAKVIDKGLQFLVRRQDPKTGKWGKDPGMYAQAIATIAVCEAYGMSKDGNLRRPAQLAVNYIVKAQHEQGGWRYTPGQAGDTSVTGWQVILLHTAELAGLEVPKASLKKAASFLENTVCSKGEKGDEGYGYTGVGSTPTLSAVGLLCREHLQQWGPQNPRMAKGVKNFILRNPPNAKNIYYSYYATQVLFHLGGEDWEKWNEKLRNDLVAAQEKGTGPMAGSWSSAGDPHSASGGRLMQTSLSLLTLEIYYRYMPMFGKKGEE